MTPKGGGGISNVINFIMVLGGNFFIAFEGLFWLFAVLMTI